jgi:hypothetical protein
MPYYLYGLAFFTSSVVIYEIHIKEEKRKNNENYAVCVVDRGEGAPEGRDRRKKIDSFGARLKRYLMCLVKYCKIDVDLMHKYHSMEEHF